jgi:hypothetical protein
VVLQAEKEMRLDKAEEEQILKQERGMLWKHKGLTEL